MNPKVSVVIPIYNTERYLEKCLTSIVEQSLSDIEIICVDDQSPDRSSDIVKMFASTDNRIKLVVHEHNLGLGCARNTAIERATANYIASVDSDDFIDQDMMEKLYLATEDETIDLVTCGFRTVTEGGEIISQRNQDNLIVHNTDNSIDIFSATNPAFWNKLIRKSLFLDNGIRCPNHWYEDMATTPRLVAKCSKLRHIDSILYNYLSRENSIMSTFSEKNILDYFKAFSILEKFLIDNGLMSRYRTEYRKMINQQMKFYASMLIESKLSENSIRMNLKYLLLLKWSAHENNVLVEAMNTKQIESLLQSSFSAEDIEVDQQQAAVC